MDYEQEQKPSVPTRERPVRRRRRRRRKRTSTLIQNGIQIALAVVLVVLVVWLLRPTPKPPEELQGTTEASLLSAAPEGSTAAPTQPPQPTDGTFPPITASFTQEDVSLINVNSSCGCEADVAALLMEPLDWDLSQPGPKVLILHTHSTESYTRQSGEDYQETVAYRTTDVNYNMISIGARVAQLLETNGVEVLHDTTIYDYPDYDNAYRIARDPVQDYIAQYPSIQLVLDIHRDAAENPDGSQWRPTARQGDQTAAKIMLVVGTGCEKGDQPHWKENMAVAVKLNVQMEKLFPGICRELDLRSSQFNQDLSRGFLLAEVGAAGNSHEEALAAAETLAQAVYTLIYSCQ